MENQEQSSILSCHFLTCSVFKAGLFLVLLFSLLKLSQYIYKKVRISKLRKKKLNRFNTTKLKLLQKLVGLKKPIENRDVLTSLSYQELKRQIQCDELETIDVIEAFQAKMLEVGGKFNCISDVIYDADVTALYLDSIPKEERRHLHGIPLSVLDGICQDDYDSYFGCTSRSFQPEQRTASVIKALEQEGMIPFVRTTCGQSDLSIDCRSYLHGETLNPRDISKISGGLSGGEGSLIGASGSPVGVGIDVCGGVRIPASFCGVFGFKPTLDRVGRNHVANFDNFLKPAACDATVGLLSKEFDLLLDVLRVLFSSSLSRLQSRVCHRHFDEDVFSASSAMKIGFYKTFSDTSMSMSCDSAICDRIEQVKDVLIKRGHTLVEWEPPRIAYASDLLVRCIFADGGRTSSQLSKSDIVSDDFLWTTGFPCIIKGLLQLFAKFENSTISKYLGHAREPLSVYSMQNLMAEVQQYQQECDASLCEANIDAVLCPVLPFNAPATGSLCQEIRGITYSALYNMLNYPAGVVPLPTESVGQALGVQCVSHTFQDEKVLRLMNEIQLGLS